MDFHLKTKLSCVELYSSYIHALVKRIVSKGAWNYCLFILKSFGMVYYFEVRDEYTVVSFLDMITMCVY